MEKDSISRFVRHLFDVGRIKNLIELDLFQVLFQCINFIFPAFDAKERFFGHVFLDS